MRNQHHYLKVEYWCNMFGKTRQAWYKANQFRKHKENRESKILVQVKEIRIDQPRVGSAPLSKIINNNSALTGLNIGRDALHNLLDKHDLLVKSARRYRPKTTDGDGNSLFKDLRIGMVQDRANQFWSSDITYIDIKGPKKHCYATFVVDEYSHLVVGHTVSERMTTAEIIQALRNGILTQNIKKESCALIHHSDRGSQFKSELYQDLLKEYGIIASMTQNGSPYENPVSERLNGIIKNDLMLIDKFDSLEHARLCIGHAVMVYNNQRLHSSCNDMTPQQAHLKSGPLIQRWKKRTFEPKTE